MDKKIIIGSDHGGFSLKELIKGTLEKDFFEVKDVGCYDTNSVDYPTIGREVSQEIASGNYSRGILICGTGIGMSMVANRFKNVRATLCKDYLTAKLSREHNDSNILVLGARVTGTETAISILDAWLSTRFSGGRHQKRIDMLDLD